MPFLFSDYGSIGAQVTLVTADQVPLTFRLSDGVTVDASAVTYTPADPNDWPAPPPSNVAAALDLLGAPLATALTNPLRVPLAGESDTLNLGTWNVVPQKSGVYLAWAQAEFRSPFLNAAAIPTLQILLDTVAQTTAVGQGVTLGETAIVLTQLALVTTNRLIAHDWDLLVTTGNALATGHALASSCRLTLLEL